jgi:hypothetical protein
MLNIKIFIAVFLVFSTIGCATRPPVEDKKLRFKYDNDCLPQAIIMTESLKEKNVEARVLRIYTNKWGHAICVYMYPKGQNKMWGWDRVWKSNRIRAWKEDPIGIANYWIKITMSDAKLIAAEFD